MIKEAFNGTLTLKQALDFQLIFIIALIVILGIFVLLLATGVIR